MESELVCGGFPGGYGCVNSARLPRRSGRTAGTAIDAIQFERNLRRMGVVSDEAATHTTRAGGPLDYYAAGPSPTRFAFGRPRLETRF